MFISTDILYFIITIVCGVGYGYYCYKNGLRAGAENAIFYLEDLNFITVDEESGEINRVSDRQFKR